MSEETITTTTPNPEIADQDTDQQQPEVATNTDDEPTNELANSSAVDWRSLKFSDGFSDIARRRVLSLAAANNKSTYRKVEEAIAGIGTSDTGASVLAIVTWILNNYATLDPSKLKINVKRAVLKGLKNGRLVRAKSSKKAQGVTGSFTFPAQRIKLKAVRLEGRKYVFPILQPVNSAQMTESQQPEDNLDVSFRKKLALEVVKSSPKGSPKRLPKSRVHSGPLAEIQKPEDNLDVSYKKKLAPEVVKSSPKRLPKSRVKRDVGDVANVSVSA